MKYFGTDGIRGVFGKTLSLDLVEKVGYAIARLFDKKIMIATDTRISKDEILNVLLDSLSKSGKDIVVIGVATTPALIYLSQKYNMLGIMITASHNPYTDNGIKIVSNGVKLPESLEQQIEYLIDNPSYLSLKGNVIYDDSYLNDYYDMLTKHINKTNKKIAIDLANGAAYSIAKNVFSNVSDDVIYINDKPNGININDNCGSLHLDGIIKAVLDNNCDLGFAFDGDADRIMVISKNGKVLNGDHVVYFFAKNMKKFSALKNNTVVLTIMSNIGIINKLESLGINVIETPVGDKYVKKELYEKDLNIGGEASGHIVIKNVSPNGDAILNAILFINAVESLDLEKELDDIKLYPERLTNIKVNDKAKALNNDNIQQLINEINLKYKKSKVSVRPSGTEDLIRVYISLEKKEDVDYYTNKFIDIIKD